MGPSCVQYAYVQRGTLCILFCNTQSEISSKMAMTRIMTTKKTRSPSKVKAFQLLLVLSISSCLSLFFLLLEETNAKQSTNEQLHHHHNMINNDAPHNMINTSKPKNKVRNKKNRSRLHKSLQQGLSPTELHYEKLPSVDYYACCGLGHRLSKLTDAWYVSRNISFALKTFWGFCDEHTEVFSHLFGSQPPSELTNVHEGRQILQLRNEVPGMQPLIRKQNVCMCDGHEDKIQTDLELYRSLYNRYQFKRNVDEFMLHHNFANHTVLGMHIRAGNGEAGDFINKKRGIPNVELWVQKVTEHLQNLLRLQKIHNPMLYIATDTPAMIGYFRKALLNMTIVDLPQDRAETGVLFGERGAVANLSRSECLGGWIYAMTDMMLLSSADIVIAARPSSFVHAMPHSLAFGNKRSPKPFCEMPPDASWFKCYRTYRQWCCTTTTRSVMQNTQTQEFIQLPLGPLNMTSLKHKFFNRRRKELVLPMHESTAKGTDLPYAWDKLVAKFPGAK